MVPMSFYILAVISVILLTVACLTNNRTAKVVLSVIGFFGFLLIALLSAGFLLSHFIGLHGVWLSFVLCGAIYVISLLFIFKPFKVKIRRIAALSIVGLTLILAFVFIAPPLYKSSIPQLSEEVDLRKYMPFGDYILADGEVVYRESSAAKLNEESTLKLNGELPRLDGATALYPLYAAFVRATYPESGSSVGMDAYSPYGDFRNKETEHSPLVTCTTTPLAFDNLLEGYADIVFLMDVSNEQRERARQRGLELQLTPIGREAFVFFVNSRNPAQNLSTDDIRRIYSGEINNWREINGDNGKILAYQRPDESGSQTMLQQIMGDIPLVSAPMDETFNTMMGMYRHVADYRNYKNSLGYSFLYYIKDMIGENKVKFLSIDGIEPTSENIANATYPFANNCYAVTVRKDDEYLNPLRTENIDKLVEWFKSPQGQFLVKGTGYLPMY